MRFTESVFYLAVLSSSLFKYFIASSVGNTKGSCLIDEKADTLFKTIRWAEYRDNESLNTLWDIAFFDCVKECQLRTHCEAIGYRRLYHQCRLFERTDRNAVELVHESASIYMDINLLGRDQPYLGACRMHDCDNGYRCNSISDSKICEPSECFKPQNIENADLQFVSQAIGTRAKYTCKDGYTGHGNSEVICETNLTWTYTSFECVEFWTVPGLNNKIIIVTALKDFHTAKAYCSLFDGGHLLKIDSEKKNDALADFFQGLPGYYYYIDGNYNMQTGEWTYSNGSALSTVCWDFGQPSSELNEQCLCITHNFRWHDINCIIILPSICEVGKQT